MALRVLRAIKEARNCVPIIDVTGNTTGERLRLLDPSIKKVDSGVFQLTLGWDSRRSYNDPEYSNTKKYNFNVWSKAEKYAAKEVSDAVLSDVSQYAEKLTDE